MARALVPHGAVSDAPQFPIDKRNRPVQTFPVARFPPLQ
jgi:hypothetical protein